MAGRPKKEENKKLKHDIHFKVNDDEYALLKIYSECENLSVSQLIRNKAMNAVIYDAQRAVKRSEAGFIAHKNSNK